MNSHILIRNNQIHPFFHQLLKILEVVCGLVFFKVICSIKISRVDITSNNSDSIRFQVVKACKGNIIIYIGTIL
jgi:hypothetical protein